MKWVGLTGGLGSGKTTVARRLRDLGCVVADADVMAKEVLEQSPELLKAITERFGPKVLDEQGHLDRKSLGQIVFSSKQDLLWLESQIHPQIKNRLKKIREDWTKAGATLAFYDVPLLFEKKMEDQFDAVVVVYAPPSQILKRVVQRDKMEPHSIHARISNQIPLEEKRKKAHFVLENDKDLNHLYRQIDQLLIQLKK